MKLQPQQNLCPLFIRLPLQVKLTYCCQCILMSTQAKRCLKRVIMLMNRMFMHTMKVYEYNENELQVSNCISEYIPQRRYQSTGN